MWLYTRPDTDKWWMGYYHNGKKIQKSTGQTDKVEAQKVLKKVEAMIALQAANALTVETFQALSGKTLPNGALKSAMDSWINEAAGATAPSTLIKYQAVRDDLIKYLHATERGPLLMDITQ